MAKFEITREEKIPFIQNGEVMQMAKFTVRVKAIQEDGETIEELENKLEETFERNLKITLKNDETYKKLTKQLNFLARALKKLNPNEADKILLEAKNLKANI